MQIKILESMLSKRFLNVSSIIKLHKTFCENMSSQQHIVNLNKIFKKSVDSVLTKLICTENGISVVDSTSGGKNILNIRGQHFDLTNKQLFVIGFGKAVLPMAVQLEKYFPNINGLLSIPLGAMEQFKNNPHMQLSNDTAIEIMEGAKGNYPDENALKAASRIEQIANSLNKDTVVFVLVSGGGSALLPMPKAPFTLTEKMQLIRSLSNSGASIEEMNIVRIALSNLKGGRLAALLCKQANLVISFIISDIVGNPLELIASGPTVPLKSAVEQEPQEILSRYNLWQNLSADKQKLLLEPLPSEETLALNNNHYFIVGSNEMAVKTAISSAKDFNYTPCLLTVELVGEVTILVNKYMKLFTLIKEFWQKKLSVEEFRTEFPFDKTNFDFLLKILNEKNENPILLILAGEPTVQIKGCGLGGRSQQLALHMSYELYRHPEMHDILFYAAGTDGIDGPTTAAGAIGAAQVVKDELCNKGETTTLTSIWNWIENNDAFNFYNQLNNGKYHIVTGHTGLNVMDLHFIIIPKINKN